VSDYQPLPPGKTPGRLLGGALLLAGLALAATSRREPDENEDDLDDVEWVYARTDGRCFYCDKEIVLDNRGVLHARGAWVLDHFIPFSRGGSDETYNLVPACIDCNTQKSDLMPWEFDPETFANGDRDPDNYL
jgi:5-methylcytosine-specific restriction endonuclease McrA